MKKAKKITFEGWKNCIEISSGKFRVIVSTEIGPRVIGAFYGKSKNLFHVDPALAGTKAEKGWVNYGGHRLWHAPETKERTYEPDNGEHKVTVIETEEGGYEFLTPPNPVTGISKSLAVIPADEETFQVIHTIRNDGVWEVEAAAWALSVMAPGGVAVAPQNKNETALLPTSFYSLWPYTKMNDPRITWGEDFLMVRQDPKAKGPMKVGFNCQEGWLAYINQGIAFIKQFIYEDGETYPDNGCSIEIYTNKNMLEAETLSPLMLLAPGDEITHTELWSAIPADAVLKTEDDVKNLFCGCDCEDECTDECGCSCGHDHHAGGTAKKKSASKTEKKPAKKAASKKSAKAKK